MVDPHIQDSVTERLAFTRVAHLQPIDPGLDPGRCRPVPRLHEPRVEDRRREDGRHEIILVAAETVVSHGSHFCLVHLVHPVVPYLTSSSSFGQSPSGRGPSIRGLGLPSPTFTDGPGTPSARFDSPRLHLEAPGSPGASLFRWQMDAEGARL
jgi:hypothetical protein